MHIILTVRVAYAAHKFGAKAVIVMPTTTPLIKVERTKSYGAEVILKGDVYDEACAYALELAEKESKRLLDRKLSKFIKMSVLSKSRHFLLKFLWKIIK